MLLTFRKMPAGYKIFENFEKEQYVHFDDLKHMVNYIWGNLNSYYSPNYKYWYNQCSYLSKAYIVCSWRQKKCLQPIAKWGVAIFDGELVNFFKEHKDCKKGCGNLYYK